MSAQSSRPGDGRDGALVHVFLMLCLALVGAFGAWAWYGRLDVVATALGAVIPSTQVKSVQHLEGGIVRRILIKEGDRVASGQALIELEPVRSGADVGELEGRIEALRVDIARLEAEATDAEDVDFPADVAKKRPKLVSRSGALFATRRSRFANSLVGAAEQVRQRQRSVEEIGVAIQNNRERLKLLREQIVISENLVKDQLSNRMQHLTLLRKESELKGKIAIDSKALPRVRAEIAEAKALMAEMRDNYFAKVREDLDVRRREFEQTQRRLSKFADSLRRTVLRSPVDGVVKTLYVVTVGGVIGPGGTVADVVPAGDRLIIEARLPTQDVGYVHPGQPVLVRLASPDAMRFGNIEGEVVHVSPDTVQSKDGAPFYKVRVATSDDRFRRGEVSYNLLPGVQVFCAIITGERSVLSYLLDPFLGAAQTALRER